jgi:hypothetical protein
MSAHLLIEIDQDTFEKAQQYAASTGCSVEEMVSNYLKLVARKNDKDNYTLTAIAKTLKGVVHSNADITQLLSEELEKNHQQ